MDERRALEKIGFTPNEATVYLTLLKMGPSGAGAISTKSDIHRRTVYDTLESLHEKGLVGIIDSQGKRMYSAASPSRIQSIIDEKESILQDVIPRLQKIATKEKDTQITVLKSKKGMKTILQDIIDVGKTLRVFGGQMQIVDALGATHEFYVNEFKKRKIKKIGIFLDKPEIREKANKWGFTGSKFIDPTNPSDVVWWTYGDRLILIVWKKEMEIVKIINPEYVKAFNKNFDMLFGEDTKTYRGIEGIVALLEDTLDYKEVCFIGGSGKAPLRMWDYLESRYNKEAIKRDVVWKNLAYKRILSTKATQMPYHKIRIFPKNVVHTPNVVWIWGDKVANVLWLDVPVAFVIENKKIAKAYRTYFEHLWRTSKQSM